VYTPVNHNHQFQLGDIQGSSESRYVGHPWQNVVEMSESGGRPRSDSLSPPQRTNTGDPGARDLGKPVFAVSKGKSLEKTLIGPPS